jgi:hypothetical protein
VKLGAETGETYVTSGISVTDMILFILAGKPLGTDSLRRLLQINGNSSGSKYLEKS